MSCLTSSPLWPHWTGPTYPNSAGLTVSYLALLLLRRSFRDDKVCDAAKDRRDGVACPHGSRFLEGSSAWLSCCCSAEVAMLACHACMPPDPHHTPYHTIPFHTMPYYATPHHTRPCHLMPPHPTSCHSMPCYALPHHTTPHRPMSCHAIPHHIMPPHAMPRHPMPCHTTPSHVRGLPPPLIVPSIRRTTARWSCPSVASSFSIWYGRTVAPAELCAAGLEITDQQTSRPADSTPSVSLT